ncbi:MAG: SGNH/GDSL hydrolase family protein [Luteolibacter sp.]
MMIKSLAILSLLAASLVSAAPDKPYQPEEGSDAEKVGSGVWAFEVDESLPNVLIIGDSISIGYTVAVRKDLEGKANVFRPMSKNGSKPENSQGTTNSVKRIDAWLKGRKWDVIHFNMGLHDLKHWDPKTGKNSSKASDPYQADVKQYARNLEEIVGKLEKTDAKLIFATTTPVTPGTTNPLREPESPAKYNKAALKIMEEHDIQVNDLFALVEPDLDKLQLPKNVHFKKEGNDQMAKQVADVITAALPSGD